MGTMHRKRENKNHDCANNSKTYLDKASEELGMVFRSSPNIR